MVTADPVARKVCPTCRNTGRLEGPLRLVVPCSAPTCQWRVKAGPEPRPHDMVYEAVARGYGAIPVRVRTVDLLNFPAAGRHTVTLADGRQVVVEHVSIGSWQVVP